MVDSTLEPSEYSIVSREGTRFRVKFCENIIQNAISDEFFTHTIYSYDEYYIRWDVPANFVKNGETINTYVKVDGVIDEDLTWSNALDYIALNLNEIRGYAINSYY